MDNFVIAGYGVFWSENGLEMSALFDIEEFALNYAARELFHCDDASVEPVYRIKK